MEEISNSENPDGLKESTTCLKVLKIYSVKAELFLLCQKIAQTCQNRAQTSQKTTLFRNSAIIGIISVADAIKPESAEAIRQLHQEGIKVIMLTGDNFNTALSIAKEAGIDEKNIVAEVRPEQKAFKIKDLQKNNTLIGMVGDGINDAPALTVADVGFAIGTGTDIAIEAGDIILSSGSLVGIPKAVTISRETLNTIRQNLFLAFVYNIILIPVAAGILAPFDFFPDFLRQLHPILAAIAMAASSISVVTNSLRLYTKKVNLK
ncbi:MAG: HAD-IC family P-type ATPase [Desulfamplus sp.]|nr:HAD-IC family P-type ATPase [Desulfamplus sp.]